MPLGNIKCQCYVISYASLQMVGKHLVKWIYEDISGNVADFLNSRTLVITELDCTLEQWKAKKQQYHISQFVSLHSPTGTSTTYHQFMRSIGQLLGGGGKARQQGL